MHTERPPFDARLGLRQSEPHRRRTRHVVCCMAGRSRPLHALLLLGCLRTTTPALRCTHTNTHTHVDTHTHTHTGAHGDPGRAIRIVAIYVQRAGYARGVPNYACKLNGWHARGSRAAPPSHRVPPWAVRARRRNTHALVAALAHALARTCTRARTATHAHARTHARTLPFIPSSSVA